MYERVGWSIRTMSVQSNPPDRVILQLAVRQHGIVSRRQLLDRGFTRDRIQHRVDKGWLVAIHPGVYVVGSRRITHRSRWLAAVLAVGDGAVLSHVSAAALWRLMKALLGPVHVSVANRNSWQPEGIRVHRPRHLEPADRTRRYGIPVTSPSRTLLDLAAVVSPTQLRRAFEEAERLELLDRDELGRLCDRMRGRRGVARLRGLLGEGPLPLSEVRSRLEARFLAFCRARGLPIPATNVPLGEFEVDCLWPEQRVVAELDSWGHHGDRSAFERDRARDAAIQRMGHRIIRITHRRVTRNPDGLDRDLRELLALDPASGSRV
jgi:Transcriptional regulator, AbiEi antitoxin/Protein of unknown function (DUF559)